MNFFRLAVLLVIINMLSGMASGQTQMLGHTQAYVIKEMNQNNLGLKFAEKKVNQLNNDTELLYIADDHTEIVFAFDKIDICYQYKILGLQKDMPDFIILLNDNYEKVSADSWKSAKSNLNVSLETISSGHIFVFTFTQILYSPKY